jgi:hypothetical protein
MPQGTLGIDIVGDIGIIKCQIRSSREGIDGGEAAREAALSEGGIQADVALNVVERVRGIEWLAGERRTTTSTSRAGVRSGSTSRGILLTEALVREAQGCRSLP